MKAKFYTKMDRFGGLFAEMGGRSQLLIANEMSYMDYRMACDDYLRKVAARLNTFDSFPTDEAQAIFEAAEKVVKQQAINERGLGAVEFPAEVI